MPILGVTHSVIISSLPIQSSPKIENWRVKESITPRLVFPELLTGLPLSQRCLRRLLWEPVTEPGVGQTLIGKFVTQSNAPLAEGGNISFVTHFSG